MPTAHPLDNPIWSALHTEHSRFALGGCFAKRYLPEIGPLSATADQSHESYDALRGLAGSGGVLALFFEEPPRPPAGWTTVRAGLLDQMICAERAREEPAPLERDVMLRQLKDADVPAMLELTEMTEPGPFRRRTIELGAFWGIFRDDRLLSMAGQRLHLPQFVEVSGVCTHPEARGKGYSGVLISVVTEAIWRRGKTPFLHVLSENEAAIRVYRRMGFSLRRKLHYAVLKRED